MAWTSGYYLCSFSVTDYDNTTTGFSLRLPGATAIADAVAYVTAFADLLKAACNAKVSKAVISQTSIPDGTLTLFDAAGDASDTERKGVIKLESEANALGDTKFSFFEIPCFNATELDDQVPAEYVCQNDGKDVNMNTANTDVAGIFGLLAPAVPGAAQVQACNINRAIFTDVISGRKKHRGDTGQDESIRAG
jgi:hypothetical protein